MRGCGMRLRLTMEPPVVWPDLNAKSYLAERGLTAAAGANAYGGTAFPYLWRGYAVKVQEQIDTGMEACESVAEIAGCLPEGCGLSAAMLSGTRCRISDSKGHELFLAEAEGGEIRLCFGQNGRDWVDISDYGPETAAKFILSMFEACEAIESVCPGHIYA